MKHSKRLLMPFFLSTFICGTIAGNANATNVSSYEEFVAATSDSDSSISVQGDITFGGDVTTTKNVHVDAPATLDLAGNTLTFDGSSLYTYYDTTITGDGKITSNSAFPIQAVDGTLTVENGTFEGDPDNTYYLFITEDEAFDSVAPDGEANANINIKGGTYTNGDAIVNNYGKGKVTVTGGTFTTTGDGTYWESGAFLNSYNGELEINGEDVEINSMFRFLGDEFIDEAEERGAVTLTKGHVQEHKNYDDDWNIVDDEVETYRGIDKALDGKTVATDSKLVLGDGEFTVAKGKTLTNNGQIIVGAGATLKICGSYEGDEANIIAQDGGEIVLQCPEEETEKPAEQTTTEDEKTEEQPAETKTEEAGKGGVEKEEKSPIVKQAAAVKTIVKSLNPDTNTGDSFADLLAAVWICTIGLGISLPYAVKRS